MVALMVAHIGYYIAKMVAGETCISSILQGLCEGRFTGSFYGGKKIEDNRQKGSMLFYSFSRLIPFGGIGWP